MKKNNFVPIENIINIAKKGGMFILVDDEKRENEGDLIISTSYSNAKNINFMAKYGRGLICLALDSLQAKRLNLSLMSTNNQSRNKTAFAVSIEAKKGITTGISAQDRAKTIKTAINPKVKKSEIVSPGHVFPLVARNGGVLERAGHTEASVDISKLSKLNPSSVICEVMNEDGRMARLNDLFKFSKKHKIKLASIEDLISYRLKYEKLINRQSFKIVDLKKIGKINIYNYKNKLENNINFAITKGKFNKKKPIPIRVLSNKIKNKNILQSISIQKSSKRMSKYKSYLLLIINNKNNVTKVNNINTLRYYGIGAQIIKDLNVKNMILISRSKKKIIGLEGFGLKIKKQIIIK